MSPHPDFIRPPRRTRQPVELLAAAVVIAVLLVLAGVNYRQAQVQSQQREQADQQRVDAVAQAKTLGQHVVVSICQSTDPVERIRFDELCQLGRDAAAKPGPEGPRGVTGPAGPPGPEPACNALPTRCVGPQGPQGEPGTPGADGRDGVDGQSPPCLSEPAQCRGADGAAGPMGPIGPAGPMGPAGPPGESNPCPGHWEPAVLVDGRSGYLCVAGSAQATN